MDCIFCKIVSGEIPSNKVYEDEKVLAFYDLHPMAKTHILIIPKLHIENADGVNAENSAVIAHIFETIPKIAEIAGISGNYRVVTNCGPDAGQSVMHLHFQILGGEKLRVDLGA